MVVSKCCKATEALLLRAQGSGVWGMHLPPRTPNVNKYSDWVVDGEYDWPPLCSQCHAVQEAGSDSQTTRLGCLHLVHTRCFVSHRVFRRKLYQHNVCAIHVLPLYGLLKSIKDTGSRLYLKLKEAVIQTGMEKKCIWE